MIRTVEHGVEIATEPTPDGMVDVISYTPHSCPWDCYGRKEQQTMTRVLTMAGVSSVSLVTHHRKLHPMGTGPGGRVRAGDDMMPGVYRVAVQAEDVGKATAAIAAHREEAAQWAFHGGPKPKAYDF